MESDTCIPSVKKRIVRIGLNIGFYFSKTANEREYTEQFCVLNHE
jgi:hypothetical protein